MPILTLDQIITKLEGQVIKKVIARDDRGSDSGLKIILSSGDTLQFGYSGCEGKTIFNGQAIEELD